VVAELQANAPGVQGPISSVPDADPNAAVEEEVIVAIVLLDIGEAIVNAGRDVDCEMDPNVVLEMVDDCGEGESGLLEDVVLERIG
jgi:hypothetical protein